MEKKLKHPYVYVYELERIISPAKARLALLSHMNPYDRFHFFCKYCGVKLAGKGMKTPQLGEKSKQPHCSDFKNIQHKSFCDNRRRQAPRERPGGTRTTPPPLASLDVYIPTHLIYTPPHFAYAEIEDLAAIDLLNEVPHNVVQNAPDEELSDNEYEIYATYWLKEVVDAYIWLKMQVLEEDQWPTIQMGDSTFNNRYQYLFKTIERSHYFINQNKIFYGTIEAKYVTFKTDQEYYSLFSKQDIWVDSIKKFAHFHIKIPKQTCQNTILETILEDLIKNKKKNFIYNYYLTNHSLDIEPIEITKDQHSYYQCELVINNPFLFVLICNSSTEE